MTTEIYVCEGDCKGEATPMQIKKAKKELTCQDPDCNLFKKTLTKYFVCEKCWKRFKEGQKHSCKT